MAHIEGTQFFQKLQEEAKKLVSKYSDEAYLEAAYTATAD
jgi:hypothetical protein